MDLPLLLLVVYTWAPRVCMGCFEVGYGMPGPPKYPKLWPIDPSRWDYGLCFGYFESPGIGFVKW